MKSKRILIFLIPFFLIAVPLFVFAAGLVPCGGEGEPKCSLSCFYVLIDNVINFLLWYIATPLAASALMVAGIMFLFGSSEKSIATGKAIFSATIIGLFFAFGAWLIINTILGNLLRPGSVYLPWNEFPTGACQPNQYEAPSTNVPNQNTFSAENNLTAENLAPATAGFGIDEGTYIDGVDTSTASFQAYAAANEAHPEGYSLSSASGNANCNSQLDNYLLGANLNGIDPIRVKAIIQAESSGNPNAVNQDSDGKYSYGLTQIRADTARIYDSSLSGMTDDQIGDKLINDPQYNINIGAKYYSDLLKKYNGDATLAHAAYNGGPLANKSSIDCLGMKRWQCQWDNVSHTVPNTGYNPTRTYINNINKYLSSCQ
jgi:hypothetical protein